MTVLLDIGDLFSNAAIVMILDFKETVVLSLVEN